MSEKNLHKKFAFHCVDNEIPVTHHGKPYQAVGVAYRRNRYTGKSALSVELADLNGCDSLITVGLQEFYEENNKEKNKSAQTSKM